MYSTENPQLSAQTINEAFFKKASKDPIKTAEESNAFIRSKMRQASFARELMPPRLLGDDELDKDEHSDLPRKIVQLEPDSTATFVPFKGTARRTWFKGQKGVIYFSKIESEHQMKSKFELMTYDTDIRQIIADNLVLDMSDQEDERLYETMDAIVSYFPDQVLNPAGGLNSNNVVEGFKNLVSRKIPIGKILCTEELYMDALKLPATSIGDAVAGRHFDEGLKKESSLWGYPVVTTIKNDIVPNNEMWIVGPERYLGKFFLIQDATLYLEQRADILEFWSYSVPGIGILNTRSITKVVF